MQLPKNQRGIRPQAGRRDLSVPSKSRAKFVLSRGSDSARTCFKSNDGRRLSDLPHAQSFAALLHHLARSRTLIIPNGLNHLVVPGVNSLSLCC